MDSLPAFIEQCQHRTNEFLDHYLSAERIYGGKLLDAIRYTALQNGKRVRPILVYATATALGLPLEKADPCAAAIELIHTYSLVHDDLPAMDDDELRRGRPTCHIAFDEATAILAGDAMQTLAFQLLTDTEFDVKADHKVNIIQCLAKYSGSSGMISGQAIDLASVGKTLSLVELERMHLHKTGALIRASVKMGALLSAETSSITLHKLDQYARAIGLAFQVKDDILDIEADTATLGKRQGADAALNKPTYPSILGLESAKKKAEDLRATAKQAIQELGPQAKYLRELADYIVDRNH